MTHSKVIKKLPGKTGVRLRIYAEKDMQYSICRKRLSDRQSQVTVRAGVEAESWMRMMNKNNEITNHLG